MQTTRIPFSCYICHAVRQSQKLVPRSAHRPRSVCLQSVSMCHVQHGYWSFAEQHHCLIDRSAESVVSKLEKTQSQKSGQTKALNESRKSDLDSAARLESTRKPVKTITFRDNSLIIINLKDSLELPLNLQDKHDKMPWEEWNTKLELPEIEPSSNGPQHLQATYSHQEPHSSFAKPQKALLGRIQPT